MTGDRLDAARGVIVGLIFGACAWPMLYVLARIVWRAL